MTTKTKIIVVGLILFISIVIIIGVVGITALIVGGYRQADTIVSPKIDLMFDAINDGVKDDTYNTLLSNEFRSNSTPEQYETLQRTLSEKLGPLKSKKVKSFNFKFSNGINSVDAVYDATFEKGNGTIRITLIKQNDDWKVYGFFVNSPIFDDILPTEICSSCGAAHQVDAKFCPSCGVQLNPEAEASTSQQDEPTVP
jgi:hypothetical protein